MTNVSDSKVFENVRPRLMGLAYRMLGSMADAEDAVQDTFVKWQASDKASVLNAEAFLTTVCTNCCLDVLKSAHKKRVDYVGPWIPEPLQIGTETDPESDLTRAESLTTAFLLLLERLSPKERAAYLLREVFGKPYGEVAETLGISETACRQLVSRAGRHVRSPASRFVPPPDDQERMLTAFLAAVESGSVEDLGGLLADSVQFQADGGGKATAIGRVLEGPEMVGKYVARILGRLWAESRLEPGNHLQVMDINGLRGFALFNGTRAVTVLTLGYSEDGRIDRIYIVRNPEKLQRLAAPLRHDPASGAIWH
ncbi:RNA polymerase sigma factor SigJ [Roseibium sp.]|uniref:RNA polymerase sigma factor SigJ n=1 Tax=Roseibium sp. TaxID=1936156 RepID=UPI003D13A1CC